MNGTRLGFLGLIVFLGATLLVPAHFTGIAQAAPAWMSDLTVVQMLDSPSDYKWMATWNPVLDYDWQSHYGVVYVNACDRCAARDYDVCATCGRSPDVCATCDRSYDRCDRCAAARDYGRSPARDYDVCATCTRSYDVCATCANNYERCDRCAAARDYGRSPARDCDRCDRCAARDCDRYPYATTGYRCDLFGCGWVQ